MSEDLGAATAAHLTELCGRWLYAGVFEGGCERPSGHAGPCAPKRSLLTREVERLEQDIDAIDAYISIVDDTPGVWPYEGPDEDRPPTPAPQALRPVRGGSQ